MISEALNKGYTYTVETSDLCQCELTDIEDFRLLIEVARVVKWYIMIILCICMMVNLVIAKSYTTEAECEVPENFMYFPNLESIKLYFRNYPLPIAHEILDVFEKHCLYMEDPGEPTGRRRPFIVIEGNHRTSRDVMGMKLAARLRGRYLTQPASCLHDYFTKLPKGSDIRRAFYLLSVYATVFQAKVHLNLHRTVIINGYWWEQVVFSLLQALPANSSLPSTSCPLLQAPEDLMQPDIIAYVYLPDSPNNERYRMATEQRKRAMMMYQRLQEIYPITFQEVQHTYRVSNDELYATVRRNLSDRRDFRVKNYYDYY